MKKISNYSKENVQTLSAGNYQVVFDVLENDYIITERGNPNIEQTFVMYFSVKTKTYQETTAINRKFKVNQPQKDVIAYLYEHIDEIVDTDMGRKIKLQVLKVMESRNK